MFVELDSMFLIMIDDVSTNLDSDSHDHELSK